MSTEMRNTLGKGPMGDVVARAIAETGGWSIEAMRAPGFRAMADIAGENSPEFRALAPLFDKSQVVIDKAVVEVGLQRLNFVKDLMSMGLTYNLPDPLSITQLEYYKANKVGAAQRTMSPSARGENKLQDMLPFRLPVYLTTDQFDLDIRTLKMSQRVGLPLETNLIKSCVRSVNEAIEDAAINGATTLDGQALQDAGYTAPGLLTAPNAQTQALTIAAWTTAPVGSTVFAEVMLMIGKMQTAKKYGPYKLYVGTAIGNAIQSDYNATNNAQGLTIAARLGMIDNFMGIGIADMMPVNKAVLVQMTSDVVDIVVGQPPTVIPWVSLDGFTSHNLVMAIMIPRFRSDYDGNSGVVIGTLA